MAKRKSIVTVFADTNLGTHIGMAMSPDITAGELKRELEREHLNCFPKLGVIRISKLRVKRKSCFYCMPDSLPIKYAFQGFKGIWFIFIEERVWGSFEKLLLSDFKAQQIGGHILNDNDVTDTLNPGSFVTSTNKNNLKRRRKSRIPRFHCFKALILLEVLRASHFSKEKKRLKRVNKICFLNHPTKELVDGHLQRKEGISAKSRFGVSPTRQPSERSEEWNPYSHVESPSETLSKSLSVSDIIKKFFSNYDEVTSASETTFGTIGKESSELPKAIADNNCSKKILIYTVPQYTPTTPQRVIVSSFLARRRSLALSDKPKKTEVGKCLAIASSNLGISACNKRHESSICRLRQKTIAAQIFFCCQKFNL